jgi:hypothetical protein
VCPSRQGPGLIAPPGAPVGHSPGMPGARTLKKPASLPLREDGSLRLAVVADTHWQPHPATARHAAAYLGPRLDERDGCRWRWRQGCSSLSGDGADPGRDDRRAEAAIGPAPGGVAASRGGQTAAAGKGEGEGQAGGR